MAEGERQKNRGLLGGIVSKAAPIVVRNVDMDAVLAELDVNAIAAELDLDALVERLDIDAVAARLDLDALLEHLDVNAVAERLDLDALVQRLDVNAVAERIDIDAVVRRVDVDAIAAQMDLDALVERIDVDTVAARIDLDAVMERVDVASIAAGATTDVATSGLDLVRRQLVRIDRTVEATADRLLRRPQGFRPEAPGRLTAMAPIDGRPAEATIGRRAVSGHYAGPVTRLLAVAVDVFAAFGLWGLASSTVDALLQTLLGAEVGQGALGWISVGLLAAWLLAWFWVPVAMFGRTAAMAAVGLGVVRRDGGVASSSRAFVRALVLPVSIALLGLGFVGAFVGRERRTLHDVAAGTVLVYDWGSREAEQPASIRELLSARVRRRSLAPEAAAATPE